MPEELLQPRGHEVRLVLPVARAQAAVVARRDGWAVLDLRSACLSAIPRDLDPAKDATSPGRPRKSLRGLAKCEIWRVCTHLSGALLNFAAACSFAQLNRAWLGRTP